MPIIDATGDPTASDPAPVRRRAAARFEDLLHAAPEALLVVGDDGIVIEANRRALDMIVQFSRDQRIISRGYSADELFAANTRGLS